MGGARTHVLGLAQTYASTFPDDHVLLVAQPEILRALADLPSTWTPRAEPAQTRGNVGRFVWEQLVLPRLARQWGADVLLSYGSFVPLRSPCPTVLHASNALPFTPRYWHRLRSYPPATQVGAHLRWSLLRRSLQRATRILTPSRAMCQMIAQTLPTTADRLDVAPLGVGLPFHQARWQPPPSPEILAVSLHGVNKEFDILLHAFDRLRRDYPTAKLALTGTPEQSTWARAAQDLVQQLGLGNSAGFVGDLSHGTLPLRLAQSSIVVFPTWSESFGLPLAEALAVGVPTIAGDVPACREVAADAARYYHPGNAESLAAELAALLGNPTEAAALAGRAKGRGADFTWERNVRLTRDSLRRAVDPS